MSKMGRMRGEEETGNLCVDFLIFERNFGRKKFVWCSGWWLVTCIAGGEEVIRNG